MALADIMNSRATFLLLLITLFGGCKTSQTQKGTNELDENFHYGIPYEEVLKRADVDDVTDLICYREGYVLAKTTDTPNQYNTRPNLSLANLVMQGHAEIHDISSQSGVSFTIELGDYAEKVAKNDEFGRYHFTNFENNVLPFADTTLDRSYGDQIITPEEAKKANNLIYRGKYKEGSNED